MNEMLAELLKAKQRCSVEGESYEERETRFGKVVQESRAEWKQNIAKACSKIALSDPNERTARRERPSNR